MTIEQRDGLAELDRLRAIVDLAGSPEFIEMLEANRAYQRSALSAWRNIPFTADLRRTRIGVIDGMLEIVKGEATHAAR